MNIKEYLKDRTLFLFISFMIFAIVWGIMVLINIPANIIIFVFCTWFLPVFSFIITMFSFKGSYDKMVKGNTSFEASSQLFINTEDQKIKDIREYMDVLDFKYDNYENHVFFKEYKLNITISDLLDKYLTDQEKKDFAENYLDGPLSSIKVSEYNSNLQIKGKHSNYRILSRLFLYNCP